jgi:tetratricopeptide (TPR) repeat protein
MRPWKCAVLAVVRDALGTPTGVLGGLWSSPAGREVDPRLGWMCMAWSPELARVVRVVAVSPGDVMVERERLEKVVDELNRRLAPAHGCLLSLWRWETDAHPGLHLEGPQGLIDVAVRIEDADVVIGIFWKRFGTPTLAAGSGTEHELQRAWSAWRENGRPQVMVYFCQRQYMPQGSAEAEQQQHVLSFREAMPDQQLWWTYTTTGDFERAVREHLTTFVLALRPALTPARQAIAAGGSGRRVRFRLPLAAAHFTGREAELDAIDAALGVADRAVVTQAITGLGGVGKSQLAMRYVHRHADEYDIVAWIRAEDGGIADLSELASELDLPVARLTPAERAARAVRWLSGCDDRWLLVLDNLAAPEQLRDCCPPTGNGRVLITTRDRGMAQFGPTLTVDVFDEATAVEYLVAISGRVDERQCAARLARALGLLPLALSHAGAYCAAGTSFVQYLELLEALPAGELFDSHPEMSYARTVALTWQVSIQAAEREAPLAREVLAMAAHLAPDAIPRELFDVLLEDVGVVSGRKRLLDAFNALHRLSLAEVEDVGVSVHRLLQKTIRDDALQRGDMTPAVSALAAVVAAFPRDRGQPQTWPRCEQLLSHVLAIAAAFRPHGEAGERLVTLVNGAADYLLRADKGPRAVDVATQASACAQRTLGDDHPGSLCARANLAFSYEEAGRFGEAIEVGEPVVADCERILGSEHPDTLRARVNLIHSYRQAGRFGEAIELGKPVVADCERILGSEHLETLRAGAILAVSYGEAGRFGEAIELGEPVLADCERILGPEHSDTLAAGGNLGLSYAYAGRFGEAIELAERVVSDCGRILGPDHLYTLGGGIALVLSYQGAGRFGEAIELGKRVLADCERILGCEHPSTLAAGIVLVLSYQGAGRFGEAIELGEPVLADCERILGPAHFKTVAAGMILSLSYQGAGRFDEATELGERVLANCERILGFEHFNTRRARSGLAQLSALPAGNSKGSQAVRLVFLGLRGEDDA